MFWKNQLYNKLKLMMNMELSYYWDLHPGNIDDPFFHCWDMCPKNWDYEAFLIMDMCHKIQWDLVVHVDNCLQLSIDSHHVLSNILCGVFEQLIAIIKWMWLEKCRCEKVVFAAIVSNPCHPHFVIRTLHDCLSQMNENLLISNSKWTSDSELIWWR